MFSRGPSCWSPFRDCLIFLPRAGHRGRFCAGAVSGERPFGPPTLGQEGREEQHPRGPAELRGASCWRVGVSGDRWTWASPVMPGSTTSRSRSRGRACSSRGTNSGRGLIRLMSPRKTFHDCGNTSRCVRRRQRDERQRRSPRPRRRPFKPGMALPLCFLGAADSVSVDLHEIPHTATLRRGRGGFSSSITRDPGRGNSVAHPADRPRRFNARQPKPPVSSVAI